MLMKRDLSLKGSEAECLIDASWAVRTQSTDGTGGRVKARFSADRFLSPAKNCSHADAQGAAFLLVS